MPFQALTFAQLRNRHPEHDAAYWNQLRALMAGGKRLLGDTAAMDALFPRHPNEEKPVYENRRARAFNLPYAGEIVGDLVGQLAQDPPSANSEPKADDWYGEFMESLDGKGLTLLGYAQAMAREALTVRTAWALVELPPSAAADDPTVLTVKDQEEAGLLDAWVCPLRAEAVIDWEEDDEGGLLWACVWRCFKPRLTPGSSRNRVTDVFTFYTAEEWARYEVTYDADKPPRDVDDFAPVKQGKHSFGEVPLLRLQLPEGMWAMDKLFGAARAHFQQRSAFSYAQNKGLFPLLSAFLGPEMAGGGEVPSEAQQNPGRATGQVYGVGRVHVFGKEDRLEYTSPDAAVFTVAAADLGSLRDEMHRVCSSMANAMDGSTAAVGRSGESKAQDKVQKEQVLLHLGTFLSDHLSDMLEMVARGRGDEAVEWDVVGFRTFDQVSAAEAVDTATAVGALDIPSPTFQRVFMTSVAKRVVAHDATTEQLEDIAREIQENIADEDFARIPARPGAIDPRTGLPVPTGLPPPVPGAPKVPGAPAPGAPPRGAVKGSGGASKPRPGAKPAKP
jgi:hypothetical protein